MSYLKLKNRLMQQKNGEESTDLPLMPALEGAEKELKK